MSNKDSTIIQRLLSTTMRHLRRLEEERPSGRVEHDSRGNAVWNWAVETGINAVENTQRLLKRLEAPELSLDDKPKAKELDRDTGGGYDPYNKGKLRKR